MDASGAASAAGVVTQLGASAMSILENEIARGNADEAFRKAANAWNIPLPVLQEMYANTVGPSAMEGVHTDPALAGAQTDALAQLKDISDSGGMTLEDKVNNEMLQRDAAQRAQAQRQSIVNVLRKSGQAPGGVSAALQLGAARDQQEAGALAGAQTAADARKRAIQAVLSRGTQAGAVRSQAFNEGTAKATAADRIAQYNAQAQERAQRYNLGIPQQQFQNQTSLAAGKAGTQQAIAGNQIAGASASGGRISDFGTGLGQGIKGVAGIVGGNSNGADTSTTGPYSQAPVPMGPEGDITEEERQQRGY